MARRFARISIEYDEQCPMRDGTILRSDVYRPIDAGPLPVLLVRHPYGKHRFFGHGMPATTAMAQSGYIVVVQDVARNPRLIVCDEPTSALDVTNRAAPLSLLAPAEADQS